MSQRDEGRASLVEFLRSLKNLRGRAGTGDSACARRFAKFNPRVKYRGQGDGDDYQPIRSAN